MPPELETLYMTDPRNQTVANFIRSCPQESAPYLIPAASACLNKHYALNSVELCSMARELRYGLS